MNLKDLEEKVLEHCYDMSILKRDAPQKKIDSILDSLLGAIVRSETSFDDVILCLNDVKEGNVINLDLFKYGGNIDDYINPKWLKFAKYLWRQRSVGLGTPNAASGEAELMFIFLSPDIYKPKRGDVMVKNELWELKAEDVRVNGKITGKQFRNLTLPICKKYNLNPNVACRTSLLAVELEKYQHEAHWVAELNKLDIKNRILFVNEYLKCIDNTDVDSTSLFDNGILNFSKLRKLIVKILYKSMVNDRSFDHLIILGDGRNVKIFDSNTDKFNEGVDNGSIIVKSDYFRINQDANIGWYIS